MSRLNCWKCVALAVLLATPLLAPRVAFAEPKMPSVAQVEDVRDMQIATMKQKSAELDEAIFASNARVAQLEQQLAELTAIATANGVTEESVAIAQIETLVVTASKSEATAVTVELVMEETFTEVNAAAGWHAWKRQSPEYKKAHPWEGPTGVWCSNATRVGIPCTKEAWEKVHPGTVFLLPAPEIRVLVPAGVIAPEAIMLAPTASPNMLTLDVNAPVVTANEKMLATQVEAQKTKINKMATIVSSFVVLVFVLGFFVIALAWAEKKPACSPGGCCGHDCAHEQIPPQVGDISKLEKPSDYPNNHPNS